MVRGGCDNIVNNRDEWSRPWNIQVERTAAAVAGP